MHTSRCLQNLFSFTFRDHSESFTFVHYSVRKSLSALLCIHKALLSVPGTSLAWQLSHLNVFNLSRNGNHSNDMQKPNLLPTSIGLVFISQPCWQQRRCICIGKEKKKKEWNLRLHSSVMLCFFSCRFYHPSLPLPHSLSSATVYLLSLPYHFLAKI